MRIASVLTVLFLSATTLVIWFGRPEAADHAAFGLAGSTVVIVLAMIASIAGTVLARPATTAGIRWSLSAALVGLAIATAVLAFGHISKSDGAPEIMLGVFLFVVALTLAGTASNLIRAS
jgi:hypothetical protein